VGEVDKQYDQLVDLPVRHSAVSFAERPHYEELRQSQRRLCQTLCHCDRLNSDRYAQCYGTGVHDVEPSTGLCRPPNKLQNASMMTAMVMDVCPLCVVCYQVEVSAMGRSLMQRSPTDCAVTSFVIQRNNNTLHLP
jgi:hypothetical protein